MIKKAEQLLKEANELKGLCMTKMLNEDMLNNMDAEEFDLCRRIYKSLDLTMGLVMEQCKLFDEMDKKLNKILAKMES